MKNKLILIPIIILIILPLLVIIYPIIKNNNYEKELLNNIYNNTNYKDITYLNKDNNYYIIKTKKNVLVLDLNYEEKYSTNIEDLKENKLDLVYRRNSLYYEEKIREKDKLIYKYYNVLTNELEYETSLGGI